MAHYIRGSIFWWKSRLRFRSVPARPTIIRLSLRTASPKQARSRAAKLDLMKDALMEQMPVLRRSVKPEDMPSLYKQAFERELDRIIMAEFEEPGRIDDHRAFNRHYASYFTLLATEPQLLDGSYESFEELRQRGMHETDADALTALASRHSRTPPVSHGQLMEDLRAQGVEPSMQPVPGESSGTTPTGLPRKAGLKCCSADAKKLSNSRYNLCASAALSPV